MCLCVHTCVHVFVRAYVCACVCACIRVCVCMHIHVSPVASSKHPYNYAMRGQPILLWCVATQIGFNWAGPNLVRTIAIWGKVIV